MNLSEKISNSELAVMRILWRAKKPVAFSDIRAELQNSIGWEKSTINTLVRRLTGKGVISAHKTGVLHYTPNVSEEEYVRAEEQYMIDKLYDGSAKRFVAALCRRGELSEADIDELKAFFVIDGDEK